MSNRESERTNFAQWIDSIGQKEIADSLGIKKASIWNWRHGMNKPKWEHALKLVELSDGELTLDDIYGDK